MAAERNAERKRLHPNVVTPTSNEVVAVGCRLPHGIHMDRNLPGEPTERFTLLGVNSLQKGQASVVSVIGGFAITENVPKDFFEWWMNDHRNHPSVKNGLIFVHRSGKADSAKAMGREMEGERTGFDPIDPNNHGVRGIVTRNDKD